MDNLYRLPNGNMTASIHSYLEEWKSLGQVLEDIVGESLIGFDPGYTFEHGHNTFRVPTDIAIRIVEKCRHGNV